MLTACPAAGTVAVIANGEKATGVGEPAVPRASAADHGGSREGSDEGITAKHH